MRWYAFGVGFLLLLSSCASERDRVAPIVLPNVVAGFCVLSPSHRYVIAQTYDPERLPNQDHAQIQIFDLTTTRAITIPSLLRRIRMRISHSRGIPMMSS